MIWEEYQLGLDRPRRLATTSSDPLGQPMDDTRMRVAKSFSERCHYCLPPNQVCPVLPWPGCWRPWHSHYSLVVSHKTRSRLISRWAAGHGICTPGWISRDATSSHPCGSGSTTVSVGRCAFQLAAACRTLNASPSGLAATPLAVSSNARSSYTHANAFRERV